MDKIYQQRYFRRVPAAKWLLSSTKYIFHVLTNVLIKTKLCIYSNVKIDLYMFELKGNSEKENIDLFLFSTDTSKMINL